MDDHKPDVTTDLIARCLEILKLAEGPATAAELAGMLCLGGKFETKKRCVRAIVAELRNRQHWIVATLTNGYWLTNDPSMWKDYLEHRSIDAKQIIGEAYNRKKTTTADVKGQGLLFLNSVAGKG